MHTGLGPSGLGERIYAGKDDAAAVQRARQWWDGGGATPVTSIYDGSSTSAFLTGLMWTSPSTTNAPGRIHRHCHGVRHRADAPT
jgi:hypothetical protein